MIKIVKEEIEIDESLVSRLNVICDFKEIINYSLSVDKIKEDFEENHNSIEDLRKKVKAQNKEINDLRYDYR